MGSEHIANRGHTTVNAQKSNINGVYSTISIDNPHSTKYDTIAKVIVQAPMQQIEAHARHGAGVVTIITRVPTEIVIAIIRQNIQNSTGTAIVTNKHIIQLNNKVIPTAVAPANIDDTVTHRKQEHNPTNTNAHAPAIGREHSADIGHINVDIHMDKTHGMNNNNAIPIKNNTIYDTTDSNTVHTPTVHIIIHSTIELMTVRARTALIHRKQLHNPANTTNHTPAIEKNRAPNSGQTHIAKVTVSMHGVYTNAAIPTMQIAT